MNIDFNDIESGFESNRLQSWSTYTATLVAVVFLTNWPTYQYTVLGGPIALIYYALPLLLIVPIVVLRKDVLRRLQREPMLFFFAIYAFSGFVWLVFAQGFLEDGNRQLRLRILALSFFVSGLVLAAEADRRKVSFAIFICALFAAVTYWIDFIYPYSFVPFGHEGANPGRGSGLFINANAAGYALIVMCITAMPYTKSLLRPWLLLIMMGGVIPTFSRSAIAFALIVALAWFFCKQFDRRQLVQLAILGPILVLVGYGVFQMGLDSEWVNLANLTGRIDFFTSGGEEVYDFSSFERAHVAQMAWNMFVESPVLGNGIGSTVVWAESVSTHNMYLLFLAEQGIFGGILYFAMLFIICFRGIRIYVGGTDRVSRDIGLALSLLGLYFVVIGFFSHNLLEEPHTLLVLGFLVISELHAKRRMR